MRTTTKALYLTAITSACLFAAPAAHAWNWQEHRNSVVFATELMKQTPVCPPGTPDSASCRFQRALNGAPTRLSKLRTNVMEEGFPLESKPEDLGRAAKNGTHFATSGHCGYPARLKVSQMGNMTIETLTLNKLRPDRKPTPGCGFAPIPDKGDPFYPAVEDSTGYVLGWHAGARDGIEGDGDVFVKLTNVLFLSEAQNLAAKFIEGGIVAIVMPFYCLGSIILSGSCDASNIFEAGEGAGDWLKEGIDYIDPTNWYHPFAWDFGEARALWQFIHMDRVGEGEYNNIPGMDYRYAGPEKSDGVLADGVANVAAAIGAELGGLTVDGDSNTGIKTYAKYDEKERTEQDWQREPLNTVEFSALDKLAAYGWAEYVKNPIHAAALGAPLHALGDACIPQHLAGTSSHGHRPFEDALSDANVWLKMASLDDATNLNDVRARAYRWWAFMDECRNPDVAALIREVAAENRPMFDFWAFNDANSFTYHRGAKDEAIKDVKEIYHDGKYFTELMRPAIQNSLGAMVALLACAGNVAGDAGNAPGAFCPSGMYYNGLGDNCWDTPPARTNPFPGVFPANPSPNFNPPSSCASLGKYCENATCCSGLSCLPGPNGQYRSCEDPAAPRACSELSQPCITRGDCCGNAICFSSSPDSYYGLCGSDGSLAWPGEPCIANAECVSGICQRSDPSAPGTCSYNDVGQICRSAADCWTDLCRDGLCQEPLHYPGESCQDNTQCMSGVCNRAPGAAEGVCAPMDVGDYCRYHADCTTSRCAGGLCREKASAGEGCSTDGECITGTCTLTDGAGTCARGDNGAPCRVNEDCLEGGWCAPEHNVCIVIG